MADEKCFEGTHTWIGHKCRDCAKLVPTFWDTLKKVFTLRSENAIENLKARRGFEDIQSLFVREMSRKDAEIRELKARLIEATTFKKAVGVAMEKFMINIQSALAPGRRARSHDNLD